jgi:hypothetical protein
MFLFYFSGINVFPLDSSSKFPLDYAKEYSHQQITKVLEEAQGKFHWKQLPIAGHRKLET